jgi:hypothetical protein
MLPSARKELFAHSGGKTSEQTYIDTVTLILTVQRVCVK